MRNTLFRSVNNKKVGGVCAGLAEYFDIDVTLVRIAFVFAVFMHGGGILAYIIMWVVLPEQPFRVQYSNNEEGDTSYTTPSESVSSTKRNGAILFGSLLIIMGTFFLMDRFIPEFDFEDYFPIMLILAGGLLLYNSFKKKQLTENNPTSITDSPGNEIATDSGSTYSTTGV